MDKLESQKDILKRIICHNSISELKKYIIDENINLKYFNNENFDLLIFAIENNANPEIIKYIIERVNYKTLNYYITENNTVKIPLFLVISKNNFEVADLLLKNKANINYLKENIIFSLYNKKMLNRKNLKYLLNKGLYLSFITPKFILNLIDDFQNKLLETIFLHFSFNNDFILTFLKIYKNKEPLSSKQLKNIIKKEKSKITFDEKMYEKAEEKDNYDALKVLFNNDCSDHLLYRINMYDLLDKAVQMNDYNFVYNLLSYQPFNLKSFNADKILKVTLHNKNMDILKLLIKSSLKIKLVNVSNNTNTLLSYESVHLNQILNFAIRNENMDLITYLIENYEYKSIININKPDFNGDYPIIIAFYTNNIKIFKYLLEHGADCDIKNNNDTSLLSLAINGNKYPFIKLLLNKCNISINEKDSSGNYPLMKAISQKAFDIIILLLEYAKNNNIDMNITNMNGETPLTLSYQMNYQRIFRFLLRYLDINQKDSEGNTVLYYAIDQEDVETVNYLIRNKANANSKNNLGLSCLDLAITKGIKVSKIILQNRHDNILLNIPNSQGEIPLITIIKSKNYTVNEKEEIISYLIEKGSNINYIDKQGNSPLIHAINNKCSSIVKKLIKNGANINYHNKKNYKTILKYAIETGNVDIIKYLMGRNANDYMKNPKEMMSMSKDISESSHVNFDMFDYLMF
ncbi:hypothetical protein PIROE2DRAFT_16516 [Piromyces sp. E2]|nr:hypothetical protein PIROE2DRAFT_16516 [Piromyces sp. E2]|eukprot:OUM58266.1 hypothetical protein PIROE2DRAFT_16516 [Piromyces sp. E2]